MIILASFGNLVRVSFASFDSFLVHIPAFTQKEIGSWAVICCEMLFEPRLWHLEKKVAEFCAINTSMAFVRCAPLILKRELNCCLCSPQSPASPNVILNRTLLRYYCTRVTPSHFIALLHPRWSSWHSNLCVCRGCRGENCLLHSGFSASALQDAVQHSAIILSTVCVVFGFYFAPYHFYSLPVFLLSLWRIWLAQDQCTQHLQVRQQMCSMCVS